MACILDTALNSMHFGHGIDILVSMHFGHGGASGLPCAG